MVSAPGSGAGVRSAGAAVSGGPYPHVEGVPGEPPGTP
jgi:hypothetical protein